MTVKYDTVGYTLPEGEPCRASDRVMCGYDFTGLT